MSGTSKAKHDREATRAEQRLAAERDAVALAAEPVSPPAPSREQRHWRTSPGGPPVPDPDYQAQDEIRGISN